MEQVLLCQLSVINSELTTGTWANTSIKISAGSSTIMKNFPFSDFFFFIFPWNSLKIEYFVEFESNSTWELKNLPFASDIKENKLEINADGLAGQVNLTAKFSVLHDFRVNFESQPEILKDFKECLKDVEELVKGFRWNRGLALENEGKVELGLDVELECLDIAEKADWEYVRGLVVGLNEKLKVLNGFDFLIRNFEDLNDRLRKGQEDGHAEFSKRVGELEGRINEMLEVVKQGQLKLNEKQLELDKSSSTIRQLECEITSLKSSLEISSSENTCLKSQLKNFDIQESLIKSLQQDIQTLSQERDSLRSDFQTCITSFDSLTQQKDSEYSSICDQNQSLERSLESKQSEIFSLTSTIASLESTIKSLNSEISALNSQVICLEDQESKASSNEVLSKKHQSECIKTQENMQKTTQKFSEVVKTLNQDKLKFLKSLSDLQSNLSNQQEKYKQIEEKLLTESAKSLEYKSKAANLQEVLAQSVDSQHISKSLLRLYSDYSKSKSQFTIDTGLFTRIFVQNSQDVLSLSRYLEQVRELLIHKDEEILILRDIITELQRRIPYYPVKDDIIDQAMADYINSLSEPLKIPFVREDEGIYLFGSKKVFVKLDNGRLSSKI